MVKGKVQPRILTSNRKTTAVKTTATTPLSASSQGTSKASINHLPTCCGCGSYVTEETKALQCDKCQSKEGWKCAECLNLPSNVYDVLVSENGPPLRWFCEECDDSWKKSSSVDFVQIVTRLMDKLERLEDKLGSEVGALGRQLEGVEGKVDMVMSTVNNQIKGLASNVEGMVDSLEKTVITHGKVDEAQLIGKMTEHDDTVHKRLEDKVDDMMKAIGTQQFDAAKILEGAIKIQNEEVREEEEEMKKRVNVIVHGLGEPKGATANDRENEDKEATENLLHVISCDTVSVRQVTRLGAPPSTDSAAKPRPLRITFESEHSRDYVLKNAKNLRGKEGGWGRVFLHQDLTPRQREARKKLVREMQDRKNNGEMNLIIVNGKIVTRRT